MRVLFPYNPLNEKEADGPFNDEYLKLKEKGIACSLFDYDTLPFDEFRPTPRFDEGDVVLYRGWMLNPGAYEKLPNFVKSLGGKMLTNKDKFVKSHHLTGWYDEFREYTPETIFINNEENVIAEAVKSGWGKVFCQRFR